MFDARTPLRESNSLSKQNSMKGENSFECYLARSQQRADKFPPPNQEMNEVEIQTLKEENIKMRLQLKDYGQLQQDKNELETQMLYYADRINSQLSQQTFYKTENDQLVTSIALLKQELEQQRLKQQEQFERITQEILNCSELKKENLRLQQNLASADQQFQYFDQLLDKNQNTIDSLSDSLKSVIAERDALDIQYKQEKLELLSTIQQNVVDKEERVNCLMLQLREKLTIEMQLVQMNKTSQADNELMQSRCREVIQGLKEELSTCYERLEENIKQNNQKQEKLEKLQPRFKDLQQIVDEQKSIIGKLDLLVTTRDDQLDKFQKQAALVALQLNISQDHYISLDRLLKEKIKVIEELQCRLYKQEISHNVQKTGLTQKLEKLENCLYREKQAQVQQEEELKNTNQEKKDLQLLRNQNQIHIELLETKVYGLQKEYQILKKNCEAQNDIIKDLKIKLDGSYLRIASLQEQVCQKKQNVDRKNLPGEGEELKHPDINV